MSRPLRLEFEDAWYHVMNRGANRQKTFLDEADHKEFLILLAECRQIFGIELHAYALMGNHFHLLLRTPRANLSRAMRHLAGVYTQRFNRRHQKDGPLFRGRFKSILIDAESYLLQVARYIHLNPVKARIVENPVDFPWSSYRFYLNANNQPPALIKHEMLGVLGKGDKAIEEFKKFTEAGIDPAIEKFYSGKRQSSFLGKKNFVQSLTKRLNVEKIEATSEIPSYHIPWEPPTPETIIHLVSEFYEVSPEQIKQTRTRNYAQPRAAALYLCRQLGGHSLEKVAKIFGNCRYSAISNAIQRLKNTMTKNNKLCEQIAEMEKLLMCQKIKCKVKT